MSGWEQDLAVHTNNKMPNRTPINLPVSTPKTRPAAFSAGALNRPGNYGPSAVDLNRFDGP